MSHLLATTTINTHTHMPKRTHTYTHTLENLMNPRVEITVFIRHKAFTI